MKGKKLKLRGHKAAVSQIRSLAPWLWCDVFLDLRAAQVWIREKDSTRFVYSYKSPAIVRLATYQGGESVRIKDIHDLALFAYEEANCEEELTGLEDEPDPLNMEEIKKLISENVRKFMEEKSNS